jgi:hypothetical protein
MRPTIDAGIRRGCINARLCDTTWHGHSVHMDQPGDTKRHTPQSTPAASRYLADGTMLELLYEPDRKTTAFAVWKAGSLSTEPAFEGDGERLVPFSPRNNLIKNEAVILPSAPQDYGAEEGLVREVRGFIHRYADLSPPFELTATYYVLLSWLYDAFNELPYLRLRGDFGTGKTRTLLAIGSLCYKAFFASGASTVSPVFHTLNAFRGTLIFDEADFRFSDERAEIVKVLNNGNVRGMPVLRTMMNRQREFDPQAFEVFGPKIVATRGSYEDRGLESRFITEQMGPRPLRADIPINLPPSFREEARTLRNKLLMYRFHHRAGTKLDNTLLDRRLEPRLSQIFLPLLSVVRDAHAREELRAIALRTQGELVAVRGLSTEARVLEILAELAVSPERPTVSIADITAGMRERHGSDYERPLTNRWIGGIIRHRLGLRAYKSQGIYVIPIGERSQLAALCGRYGIALPDKLRGRGDLGDIGDVAGLSELS